MRRRLLLPLVLVALLAAAIGGVALSQSQDVPRPPALPQEAGERRSFGVERLAGGFVRPTWAAAAPGDDGALWVLEQPGRLVRFAGGERRTVLDLRRRVGVGGERGLLGVAFHPDFARNRRVFLHFSDRRGDTRVEEQRLAPGGRRAAGEPRRLLEVRQPEENHNGGQLAFGPDGRLYLGLGDGGGAFDPRNTAQDRDQRLGKLLSADVDAGRQAPAWRIEAYGLRNPWRFSFDPALNEVWIGDVGQDAREEVHRAFLEPDEGPKNFGWSAFEGTKRLEGRELDRTGELVWPVAEYTHDHGCSVIGGLVHRGDRLPRLQGRYVYGDFCTGTLWTLRPTPDGRATDVRRERAKVPQLTHVGDDGAGGIVLVSATGTLFRATP